MKTLKNNVSKKLNLIAVLLSIIFFVLTVMITFDLVVKYVSNAEDSVVVELPAESLNRADTIYTTNGQAINIARPNITISTDEEGNFNQNSVLEALAILSHEIDAAKNFSESYSQFGHELETFGSFTVKVPLGSTEISVTEATYQKYEIDANHDIYTSNCIADVTGNPITANVIDEVRLHEGDQTGDKHWSQDGITYNQSTKRISGDFSKMDIYQGTTDVVGLDVFEIEPEKLELDKCKLSKELNTYKLDLVYKAGYGNDMRKDFLARQGIIRDSSVNLYSCSATIYFSTKGQIVYMTKTSDFSLGLIVNKFGIGDLYFRSSLFESTTFNYFLKGRRIRDFA